MSNVYVSNTIALNEVTGISSIERADGYKWSGINSTALDYFFSFGNLITQKK